VPAASSCPNNRDEDVTSTAESAIAIAFLLIPYSFTVSQAMILKGRVYLTAGDMWTAYAKNVVIFRNINVF
jgi:hypothetical protein